MSRMKTPHLPRLLVVTGRPGAGKTTLAHALAREIWCPVLSRDEVKEGYVHTAAPAVPTAREVQLHVNDAFFDAVGLLVGRGITLVIEAAFQHKLWAPRLEPMLPVADVRIMVCAAGPWVARKRTVERGLADPRRERFHGNRMVRAAREGQIAEIGPYEPPALPVPTLTVDTNDGYDPDLAAMVSWCREPWA